MVKKKELIKTETAKQKLWKRLRSAGGTVSEVNEELLVDFESAVKITRCNKGDCLEVNGIKPINLREYNHRIGEGFFDQGFCIMPIPC